MPTTRSAMGNRSVLSADICRTQRVMLAPYPPRCKVCPWDWGHPPAWAVVPFERRSQLHWDHRGWEDALCGDIPSHGRVCPEIGTTVLMGPSATGTYGDWHGAAVVPVQLGPTGSRSLVLNPYPVEPRSLMGRSGGLVGVFRRRRTRGADGGEAGERAV